MSITINIYYTGDNNNNNTKKFVEEMKDRKIGRN